MGSYPDEFPFNIMDVVELLHLRVRRQQSNSVYVDCPFCGNRREKMNVNFVKMCGAAITAASMAECLGCMHGSTIRRPRTLIGK